MYQLSKASLALTLTGLSKVHTWTSPLNCTCISKWVLLNTFVDVTQIELAWLSKLMPSDCHHVQPVPGTDPTYCSKTGLVFRRVKCKFGRSFTGIIFFQWTLHVNFILSGWWIPVDPVQLHCSLMKVSCHTFTAASWPRNGFLGNKTDFHGCSDRFKSCFRAFQLFQAGGWSFDMW